MCYLPGSQWCAAVHGSALSNVQNKVERMVGQSPSFFGCSEKGYGDGEPLFHSCAIEESGFAKLLPVRESEGATTVVLKATAAVECGRATSKVPARVLR